MSERQGFFGRFLSGAAQALGMEASVSSATLGDGSPKGARYGRRSALFEQERRQINSTILQAGPTLRARSRFLCRENGYVINAKRVWTSYAVGYGWQVSWNGLSASVQKALNKALKAWSDVCDVEGLADLAALEALWADEEFEAGEVFIRMIPDARVGLKLQTIPSEQLPYWNTGDALPGNTIRLGIEFNPKGERVRYHFFARNPGDMTYVDAQSQQIEIVPADEIVHIFTRSQPGQVRGIPRPTGAIVSMYKLDEGEDAALERMAVAGKFAGFIKTVGGEDPTGGAGTDNGDGSRSFPLEAGVIYELDPNEEWQESKPPDVGVNYADFTRRMGTKGLIAMGVPYAEVSGDLTGANFSSTRIGQQPFKRYCVRWGFSTLVHQALRPIIDRWLQVGLLGGTITLPRGASRDPAKYMDRTYTPPAWEYVDPYKDAQADALMVDHGFKPRSAVIQANGFSPEETDETIKADQDRAKALGLTFATTVPTNPASETQADPGDPGEGNPPKGDGA